MKFFCLFLLIPFLSFAQTNSSKAVGSGKVHDAKAKHFTITGNIQGLGDGEVKITSLQGQEKIASGMAKNGAFALSGKLDEPGLYWLTLGKEQPQYIFLENSPVKITGRQADIKNIQIKGSQSHNDFLQFRKSFDPLFANLNALAMQLQQTEEGKKEALLQQYNEAIASTTNAVDKFVAARRSSYVSLFLLSVTKQLNESTDDLERRFNSLSPNIKKSAAGKELQEYISVASIGAVGSQAIEFTQSDTAGKSVSLASFRGKYVLLDFWASWCGPCRRENPNVVKAFNKFKAKNFTVLSVSLDQQKEPWLKAVEKDGLAWTHVSDLKFWNNEVAELYHVQSIPQNYLIDPTGKIVAKDLRGEELEKKLCELLGCN